MKALGTLRLCGVICVLTLANSGRAQDAPDAHSPLSILPGVQTQPTEDMMASKKRAIAVPMRRPRPRPTPVKIDPVPPGSLQVGKPEHTSAPEPSPAPPGEQLEPAEADVRENLHPRPGGFTRPLIIRPRPRPVVVEEPDQPTGTIDVATARSGGEPSYDLPAFHQLPLDLSLLIYDPHKTDDIIARIRRDWSH